ncbi:unnamed protein product, partial [Ascophyllum nodosum]
YFELDYAQSTIDTLHENGKYVVCYISIGSWEEWREDARAFPAEALGQPLSPPFEDELWLDVNNEDLRAIMVARVQQASSMNCDGIEPDNMDVYLYSEASAGFDISEAEQIVYNTWFADTVHDHGMVVGLKNSVELLADLVDSFDFAINEQCNEYNECRDYNTTFLEQDKPVFNVEYDTSDVDEVCDYSNALGMDTIFKRIDLKAFVCSCVDSSRNFKCVRKVL